MNFSSLNSQQIISTDNLDLAAKQLWDILEPKISYLNPKDKEVVEMAFTQMVLAHGETRRKSGEFYIIHPVFACLTLAEMFLDKDTLAACLMHDVPEDTSVTLKDLAKDFSSEIVFLVEGVTKLSSVKYKGEDRYAENLRRMFVAMSKDLRVIFIKLADRLHNLKTLEFVKPEKRQRIALESIEIYAHLAERLGISYFRGEIEDTAFPYLYPEEYQKFLNDPDLNIQKREKELLKMIEKTKTILQEEKIDYKRITGRAKRYYSLYKKLLEKNKTLEDIYDLVALRLIVEDIPACYHVLSILHRRFEPLEGRIKDYIQRPKENGYQSLHTTVKDKETGIILEFQIRTQEMHDYAEFGVASHWSYKEKNKINKKNLAQIVNPETYKWLSELIELGKQDWSEQEYLQHVKLNLFQDRIFVMTPQNDPISLPVGATALDFAYKIHREVGEHALMAKVNGEIVKLSDTLRNGDVVEIITSKNQKPKADWLKWIITSQARNQIKIFLRKEKKEQNEQEKTLLKKPKQK